MLQFYYFLLFNGIYNMIQIKNLLKKIINEVVVYKYYKNGEHIYMNPPSITRMESNLRAFIDIEGNFYVADVPSYTTLHIDIVRALQSNGTLKTNIKHLDKSFFDNYIGVMRIGDSNNFELSEMYSTDIYDADKYFYIENCLPIIERAISACKVKNPKYNIEMTKLNIPDKAADFYGDRAQDEYEFQQEYR